MFRLILSGFIASVFLVEGEPLTDVVSLTEVAQYQTSQIDPIITGQSISDDHKQKWLIQNKKYKECGLCGADTQAYPGD